MKLLAPMAITLCSATAFVPVQQQSSTTSSSTSSSVSALDACISKEEVLKTPNTIEFGKVWDPLGLADIGSDETVAWFRHSEIKHGRIAMAAVRIETSCPCIYLFPSRWLSVAPPFLLLRSCCFWQIFVCFSCQLARSCLPKLANSTHAVLFFHSFLPAAALRFRLHQFVGWWALGAGLHFPGDLATGLPFADIPTKGLEAWDFVPPAGKAQMIAFAGLIEFHDEIFFSKRSTHYLKGGTPGKVRAKKFRSCPCVLGRQRSVIRHTVTQFVCAHFHPQPHHALLHLPIVGFQCTRYFCTH